MPPRRGRSPSATATPPPCTCGGRGVPCPLAAARAVLFAQLVNDPGYQRELGFGVNKKDAEIKREKLFQIIRDLVKWENTNNEEVLNRAREAIRESWRETCRLNRNHPRAAELFDPEKLPAFHDPFAGGGAIPLEAQRLGLGGCPRIAFGNFRAQYIVCIYFQYTLYIDVE